jgi:hypothetical protein
MKVLEKLKINNTFFFTLLLILNVVYLLSPNSASKALYKLIFIFAGLVIFLFSNKKIFHNIYIWSIVFIILLIDLIFNYYSEANHHFLMTYATCIVLFYLKGIYDYELVRENIKYLAVIVLGFAAWQKVSSPQFISGEFYYYMVHIGGFFKPFIRFMPEVKEITDTNGLNIYDLRLANPNNGGSVNIQTFHPSLKYFCKIGAWCTVITEFLVAIALLIKSKSNLTHILFIMVILGIFVTRLETTFLSLLTIFGFILAHNLKLKIIYILLTLFFISLVIARIGYS